MTPEASPSRRAGPSDIPPDGNVYVPVPEGSDAPERGLHPSGAFFTCLLMAYATAEEARDRGEVDHGGAVRVFSIAVGECPDMDLHLDVSRPSRMTVWGRIPPSAMTEVYAPVASPGR